MEAARMNPCEAFKQGPMNGYRACWDCGLPYWIHSHEYEPHEHGTGQDHRARHKLISKQDAQWKWELYAIRNGQVFTQGLPPDPAPDTRPRYQIMQERRVSIAKFYLTAAQHHIHRTRPDHSIVTRKHSFGDFLDEARRRESFAEDRAERAIQAEVKQGLRRIIGQAS
jgi:hypothetical protein